MQFSAVLPADNCWLTDRLTTDSRLLLSADWKARRTNDINLEGYVKKTLRVKQGSPKWKNISPQLPYRQAPSSTNVGAHAYKERPNHVQRLFLPPPPHFLPTILRPLRQFLTPQPLHNHFSQPRATSLPELTGQCTNTCVTKRVEEHSVR